MSYKVCSTPGCPRLIDHGARCTECQRRKDRERRTKGNPYSNARHRRFRRKVLSRDPYCVCPGDTQAGGCGGHEGLCGKPSTVADHFPYERSELVDMHKDPNDPQYGRGLCEACHNSKTAKTRPFGFRET